MELVVWAGDGRAVLLVGPVSAVLERGMIVWRLICNVISSPCIHHTSIWREYTEHYRTGTVHRDKEGSPFPAHLDSPDQKVGGGEGGAGHALVQPPSSIYIDLKD